LIVERKRAKYVVAYFSKPIGNGFRKPPIRLSKETFYLGPGRWALRGDMDFILQAGINEYVSVYRAVGILTKAEKKYAPRPAKFDNEDFSNHKALNLEIVGETFIILFLGYVISTTAFFLEFLKTYIDRQRQLRNLKHVVLHYCE